MQLLNNIRQYLDHLAQAGLYRHRQVYVDDPATAWCYFNSNDYLSLARHPLIQKAYQRGLCRYPVGSGGSSLVCGYHKAHQDVEQAFAHALGVDACLLFSSGYAANVSIMAFLAQVHAQVLVDKAIHASVYDGLRQAALPWKRYVHSNLVDAANKLGDMMNPVLMTEGIFSMNGLLAPLDALTDLARTYQAAVVVDEAHAFGVIGPSGLGSVVHFGLTQQAVPLRVIPLGKAYAATGAIVAGQGEWIEGLLQAARPLIYSTAISPAYAYGILETLPVIQAAEDRRDTLHGLIAYFREAITRSSLTWANSYSPIQQLQLGCPFRAVRLTAALRKHGLICSAMRPPSVTAQATGLRITLNYRHELAHIDYLFELLEKKSLWEDKAW